VVVWSQISSRESLNPRFAPFVAAPLVTLPNLHQPDVGHLHSSPRSFCPTTSRVVPRRSPSPSLKVETWASPSSIHRRQPRTPRWGSPSPPLFFCVKPHLRWCTIAWARPHHWTPPYGAVVGAHLAPLPHGLNPRCPSQKQRPRLDQKWFGTFNLSLRSGNRRPSFDEVPWTLVPATVDPVYRPWTYSMTFSIEK
jgi:hypothetical protein